MRTSLRHPCNLVLAALAALAALQPLAPTARAASMIAPADSRPKDFSLIKKDGVYHLFYIRHNDFLPPFATEVDFGHAVSTDLYHWNQLPPVMGVNPFGWDNAHVWAPHVIESGGLYWMFYTGITETPGQFSDTQRIGAAVSSDLMTWNRVSSEPVWQLSGAPWAWWRPQNASMACRDPFVMPDPSAPGQYLMYYTASPASDTTATIVGVARSPAGDFAEWVDEKPLWITYKTFSFNVLTESPHLFQHNGRWFMFITANAGQPLSFYVGSNPLGDPAQWRYRGRLRNMLGFDTSLWFASESMRDGDADLFAFAAEDRIEIRRIVWGTGDNFSLTEPAFFHMVSMNWTRSSVREFDPIGIELASSNWFALDRQLEAFVIDGSGAEVQAPLDSLGLPARPVLTSDSTVLVWFARRWPSGLPADRPMRVRLTLDDGTATTPWLTVSANPRDPNAGPALGNTVPDVPEPEFPPLVPGFPEDTTVVALPPTPAATAGDLQLRALPATPLGTGPAVAFEMDRAGDVRADVFDLQGRRVVTLADRPFPAGAHVLAWDGRDATGGRARRGLYFVRVITPRHRAGARLLLAR